MHLMMTNGQVEVQLHSFLTMALDGDECSASCPRTLHSGKELLVPTECDAGWGTRAGLDILEILPGIKPWTIQLVV